MASKRGIWISIIVVLIACIAFALAVHWWGWDWTGFNSQESKTIIISAPQGTYRATEVQSAKNLWDWLGLLAALAIPVVVGIGAAWFTTQQAKVSDRENKDNQLEAALQAYVDKISELLLKEHLGERTADGKLDSQYKHVRNVARVRTITVLTQLNARRVGYVFAFLREAGLMSSTSNDPNDNAVSLWGADLRAVNWTGANLMDATLIGANLSGANLSHSNLCYVNLSQARLDEANLSGANLFRANLSGADLNLVNLSQTILIEANLSHAKVTEEQLKHTGVLKDAIMPDGSKHP